MHLAKSEIKDQVFIRLAAKTRLALAPEFFDHLRSKFQSENDNDFSVLLTELLRFLHLASLKGGSLFLIGNEKMDALWHECITQTEHYLRLCQDLGSGRFIHHSSIRFEDYRARVGNLAIHEEHLSWLISYIENFGPISSQADSVLPIVSALKERLALDLEGLNNFGRNLLIVSNSDQPKSFEQMLSEIESIPKLLCDNPRQALIYSRQILRNFGVRFDPSAESIPLLLDETALSLIYGKSITLGFILNQACSAIDRLGEALDWRKANESLWKRIANGEINVGLATTHLAKAGGSSLKGRSEGDGYILDGVAGWVTGYGLFDFLVIGFETEDKFVFAVCGLDSEENLSTMSPTKIELESLAGTSTVSLKFSKLKILKHQIVSEREKSVAPTPRVSKVVSPELGIVREALDQILRVSNDPNNSKSRLAKESHFDLENRYQALKNQIAAKSLGKDFAFQKDQLIFDSVRALLLSPVPRH